jgi:hypothetical protein
VEFGDFERKDTRLHYPVPRKISVEGGEAWAWLTKGVIRGWERGGSGALAGRQREAVRLLLVALRRRTRNLGSGSQTISLGARRSPRG